MEKEVRAIIRGKVQGVGFRWTVVDYAEKHHLTGTAKNLPDGTVEIVAQGSGESIKYFFNDLENDPGSAKIDSIHKKENKLESSYPDFKIIY